ncbi:MAG: ABC transporter ATP-binding protein [Chitinophagaceae bacterium]|nr:ABC transporter ATP-binding protein [Chitinophagaceae bacterium]
MKPVVVDHITKTYSSKKDKVTALNDISFEVEEGELFGIIGPDGAGKTSLFRIIATLLVQDSGKATVEGLDSVKDYKEIRNILGYMPGRFSLYQDLTVEENLNFFATIFNTTVNENYDLIKDIYSQIEPFKKRRAGKLSGGMKQKLALSCALIHKPSVLLLDEPTTGVDAVSRKEFWEMLKKLKQQGITILVSTPYMDEAGLCDRIALVQNGEVLSLDTPQGIIDSFENPLLAVRSNDMLKLLKRLKSARGVDDAYPFGEYHHVVLQKNYNKDDLSDYLVKEEPGTEIISAQPNIEDCFMNLMKN